MPKRKFVLEEDTPILAYLVAEGLTRKPEVVKRLDLWAGAYWAEDSGFRREMRSWDMRDVLFRHMQWWVVLPLGSPRPKTVKLAKAQAINMTLATVTKYEADFCNDRNAVADAQRCLRLFDLQVLSGQLAARRANWYSHLQSILFHRLDNQIPDDRLLRPLYCMIATPAEHAEAMAATLLPLILR